MMYHFVSLVRDTIHPFFDNVKRIYSVFLQQFVNFVDISNFEDTERNK